MNFVRHAPGLPLVVIVCGWLGIGGSLVAMFLFDYALDQAGAGRRELYSLRSDDLFFVAPVISAAIVGSALAIRHHPVGWLFLGLSLAVTLSGVLDSYAAYGTVRPSSLAGTGLVATVADAAFIPWLMLLSFVFLLTTSPQLSTRTSQLAAAATVIGGAVSFGVKLFEPYHGDFSAFGSVENPLALDGIAAPLRLVRTAALVLLHVGLLTGPAILVLRFRSARGKDRSQLRWLALAAIPFPILVVAAYVAATIDNQAVLGVAAGGFLAVIPVAVALAIEQDHLYDVDHLLSRGLTYSLLSAGLIGCYLFVVFFVGQSLGDFGGDSQVPAVVATLATASVALPARRYLQEALDRRFSRRRFDAVSAIRGFVREPSPAITVEEALRKALDDQHLRVAYWIDERQRWVDEQGIPVVPDSNAIEVNRRGLRTAAVSFDPARSNARLVVAVIAEALPEVENARLRAAIALQLVEVRDSRARIVAAQLAERRKIERNLHDGAQQRLLAVALHLRAAEVSDDTEHMRSTMNDAVQQLQVAVNDLRDLANGLHPVILADGGLAAALDDLAGRIPVPVHLETTAERFPASVEETAWFIACEAVTNAVKHAAPGLIQISTFGHDSRLCLTVEDDGYGGADPLGHGLRGIADRAEAAGGWLTVRERAAGGTIVTAELPCAS